MVLVYMNGRRQHGRDGDQHYGVLCRLVAMHPYPIIQTQSADVVLARALVGQVSRDGRGAGGSERLAAGGSFAHCTSRGHQAQQEVLIFPGQSTRHRVRTTSNQEPTRETWAHCLFCSIWTFSLFALHDAFTLFITSACVCVCVRT